MFDEFPKIRPVLPKEIEEIYAMHYKSNREGETVASSLAQKMEGWLHRKVAEDVSHSSNSVTNTLELGAGTLNQLKYEPKNFTYDIVEPFTSLYKKSPLLSRVVNIFSDISEVPNHHRYNRITSIAVLEHACNLPELVARSGLLLANDGVFRASVPSEGTLLWKLCWKLTTGLEFKIRYGLDYGLLMRHEHVNTVHEIEEILKYFFSQVECKVFGLSKAFSVYRYYECKKPNIGRCEKYLAGFLS